MDMFTRKSQKARVPLRGKIAVPGDKSISHRALIVAALAPGHSTLRNLNSGDDVGRTRTILERVGAAITETNGVVEVESFGRRGFREPESILDCGNSGTTLRLMLGVLAGSSGGFFLTGDESLRRRPMLRVVAPLRQMGATIDGVDHANRPPLFVRGQSLRPVDIDLPIASAQVKSALLLAGLSADGRTTVTEPGSSRDHTERMLSAVGVEVERIDPSTVAVRGPVDPAALDLEAPGDLSAAAFLAGAAAVIDGSDLTLSGVGLNPTRTGWLDVMREMGGDIDHSVEGESAGEPVGEVRVKSAALHGCVIEGARIPTIIDELPLLAVVATQAEGQTVIRDAAELRVKESDRIEALAQGLQSLGAEVETAPDGMTVTGPTRLHGGVVDSFGDHRIAMAFAIAGLISNEKVTVHRWSSIETSFPDFLSILHQATGR
jgi:3-phosphoshikimate 1-carboxyvinyltransferase